MQSGAFEYKNIRRLKVVYPEYDDKHEYRQRIRCRARDMGKVIYGKWIIGGEQWSLFSEAPYADDEEKFYTAYKLVGGAKIICNFELEEGRVPSTKFYAFADPNVCLTEDVERIYAVDKMINNYHPVYGEPETDTFENGMIYIKMPSGVEAKQTDGAAEKSTERPQIQVGDIVRFIAGETGKEVVEVVTCELKEGASYTPSFSFNPFYNEVLAIYRFDGHDFKCIWDIEEYYRRELINRRYEAVKAFEQAVKTASASFGKKLREKIYNYYGIEEEN